MISKIITPTRAQPDTVVAIFILKTFGEEKFPGIGKAKIEISPELPEGENFDSLLEKGAVCLDVGGGKFDHHKKTPKTTASKLVADFLEVGTDPTLSKLLAYAERDDFYGKGIISEDPIDRAFGLSGLIVNLNKDHTGDPEKVIDIVLPLINSHFNEEVRRLKEMPLEFETKLKEGKAEQFQARQRDKNLRVVIIESDNPSLAGYLRSINGGRIDVVAQRLSSGHLNILTRPTKKIDLRALASLIRLEEAERRQITFNATPQYLATPGKIKELPQWYFDPATNSIQNGGLNPGKTEASLIEKEALKDILVVGISELMWNPNQGKFSPK